MQNSEDLTPSELKRYDRQMMIKGWGVEGQEKLKKSKIVVMGVGGLGCPVSIYLAVGGVGHLVLIDKDKPDLSNMNRQILHWEKDIGRDKAISAKEKLVQMNSDITIEGLTLEITEENILDLVKDATVVIDAMDNFHVRYLINDACVNHKIPFVHAGIYGLEGQLTTIMPGKGPCLKCIFPTPPIEQKKFPVLGATPAVLATLQAMEAFKLVLGIGAPLIGRLLIFDGEVMSFDVMQIKRRDDCEVCSNI
ncbi:MAG: ThiF family adenylyltransferase [Promethearchaeota archaeon]